MRFAIVFVLVVAAAYGLTRLVERIPADCDAIGEQLASYELGNYTEPEERAAAIERGTERCEAARVNRDEGECLAKAHTRARAAGCVPRLFPDEVACDGDDTECLVEVFGDMADRMCACRTKACADKVQAEYTRHATELAANAPRRNEKVADPELVKELTKVGTRYAQCMTRLLAPSP